MFQSVLALLGIGVSVGTGIAVVGSLYDSGYGSAGTLPHAFQNPVAVRFMPTLGLETCPTCLFVRSDDVLLDPIDPTPSLDHAPTPTVPLESSYEGPFISHPKSTPTSPTSHSQDQLDWNIRWYFACGVGMSATVTAIVMFFLLRTNLSQKCLQLAIKTKRILEKFTTKISSSSYNPKRGFAAIHALLENYFIDEERLARIAEIRFKDTVAEEKAKLYKLMIHELEKSRKIQADELNERYERYERSERFATAEIETSFGPSVENAEREFSERLEKFRMTEGTRTEITGFFRDTLHIFSHAVAVAESRPEGRNTRYMSVIQEQERLIGALHSLNQYREQAFLEHEDLVRCLCHFNIFGELEVPRGHEHCPPWNKYSMEDRAFITSPPDGPTALSKKLSVSSAPFERRPVTILDSDPHWKKFLDSTHRKQAEQETRLAFRPPVLQKDVKEKVYICKDGSNLDICDASECSYEEPYEETEVGVDTESEDARGQIHINVGRSDGHPSSHEGEAENERDNKEAIALRQAESNLNWLKGVLTSMKARHGAPKSSNPLKAFQLTPPAVATKVTGEIAMVRQLQEQEWAECPVEAAIEDCEVHIEMLEVDIACMKTAKATSNNDASNGDA